MSKVQTENRHPAGVLSPLSPATQQGDIAATDEGETVADKADGRFAECVAGPACAVDPMPPKQHLRNGTVALSLGVGVDRLEHLPQTGSALCRQSRIGRRATAAGDQPESGEHLNTICGEIIKRDNAGEAASQIDRAVEQQHETIVAKLEAANILRRASNPLDARYCLLAQRSRRATKAGGRKHDGSRID